MKTRGWLAVAALATLIACGGRLLEDPSFDLWCGDKLCAPWEVNGDITRVSTWHRSDYGVALADGATLTQLSTKAADGCIEIEAIADVDARAELSLELDFGDDGSSEHSQLIPESHWAKLRYLVATPHWYERVRFILRKAGSGRAVLAQIKATGGGECSGPALAATDRENGARCEDSAQCGGGVCAGQPGDSTRTCGECGTAAPCAAGLSCGEARVQAGEYAACIAKASLTAGALCGHDDECVSGRCSEPTTLNHSTCAQCAGNEECAADEVCGVVVTERGPARGCEPPRTAALGEMCAIDAECNSGVCNSGACSECSDTSPCAEPRVCTHTPIPNTWLSFTAALCDDAREKAPAGAPCYSSDRCASDVCDLPEPSCDRCQGLHCSAEQQLDCGILRRLAGSCR